MDESGTIEGAGDSVIRFRCKYCQNKIYVPKNHASKKGKCPKCKNIIVVPKAESTTPAASQTTPGDSAVSSKDTTFALTFLDIPQKQKAQPASSGDTPDKTLEDLRKLEAEIATDEAEPVPERKLPWLIDIFLYPISSPGLTMLGIFIGVPVLFKIVVKFLTICSLRFPPLLVFVLLFAVVGFIINIIILLYVYWYLCECIRDSAEGGLRAPDVLVRAPSLGDMLWQTLKIIGCLIVFWGPVAVCAFHTLSMAMATTVYWGQLPHSFGSDLTTSFEVTLLLLAYAIFFFPMGLLAVIMFDSFSGLNPLLLIGSIFSTFFHYCGLVLLFCGFYMLFHAIRYVLPQSQVLNYLLRIAFIYLAMVAAHLLGRFYWRYREKLYWEV